MKNKYTKIGKYIIFSNKKLGLGTDSVVYECKDMQDPERDLAVKVINCQDLSGTEYQCKIAQIQQEITIMETLSFKNDSIIQFVEAVRTSKNVYIIMEQAQTDLYQIIQNSPGNTIPVEKAIKYFQQMLESYKALKFNNIIHKDIKPANFLVSKNKLQLADFGTAQNTKYDSNQQQMIEIKGTPYYKSPEFLQNSDQQQYTLASNKTDIWSLGIILYEMLNGQKPWEARSQKQYLYNIKNEPIKFQKDIPQHIQTLLSKMLEINQDKRITWDQLIQYPISELCSSV